MHFLKVILSCLVIAFLFTSATIVQAADEDQIAPKEDNLFDNITDQHHNQAAKGNIDATHPDTPAKGKIMNQSQRDQLNQQNWQQE